MHPADPMPALAAESFTQSTHMNWLGIAIVIGSVLVLAGLALLILAIVAFFKRRNGLGLGLLLGGLAIWFGLPVLALVLALALAPVSQPVPAQGWQHGPQPYETQSGTLAQMLVVVGASAAQIAVLVAIVSGIAMIALLIAQQRRPAMIALRSLGICVLIVVVGGAVAATASGWSMSIVAMVLGLSIGAALIWVSVRCMPAAVQPAKTVSAGGESLSSDSPATAQSDEWRKMEAMDAGAS
ncbi:MAG: hypothetical protein AAGB29_12785 [Planctomycetota bacterium]